MFEEADADVVLLYDCCNSAATTASSSFRGNKGVTEAISACGYETSAPEVGEHSFSNALTEILAGTSKGPPFTIAELHSQVLNRLKCWAPCLVKNGDGKYKQDHAGRLQTEYQPRRTPIYTILCESEPRRSILLAPLRTSRPPAAASEAGCNSVSDMATSNPAALSEPHMDPQGNTREVKQQIEKVVECPQILLTVRLDEDRLDLQSWKEFLRQLPAEGKDIKIEGAYRSFSTLLLLRLPITVWDLLPDHPAYSFVSFVSGENMALGDRLSLPLASKAIDPEVSETMDLLSLRRKEPGTDGSHLPEGGCRFFLLKPEGRMLRCACVSFALSQSVPGGNCECGHQAHCHVPNKESGTVEVQKRKVPKERAIMVEEKMAKGGSTHTPHSGFPSMSQMLSKIGINNPFTPPPSTRDALSSYAESSCTQEDLAPKIPAKRHSESRSPTLETYLDSEAIGQRLEAIDSGSKGSRSSGVFSRRASTSHKRYRRVDREPRYEYCWLWACVSASSRPVIVLTGSSVLVGHKQAWRWRLSNVPNSAVGIPVVAIVAWSK
jgi:hypothetical protein